MSDKVMYIKTIKRISTILMIVFLGCCLNSCAYKVINLFTPNMTYSGRLVDAETLKPIEGAAIVGLWREWRGGGVTNVRARDAKETLTDKNGEWKIVGKKVYRDLRISNLTLTTTFTFFFGYIPDPVYFMWFKPGYCKDWTFIAYPYKDKEFNLEEIYLEGIVFRHKEKEWKSLEYYYTEKRQIVDVYKNGVWIEKMFYKRSFIPLKYPEQHLRNMTFDFNYPKNVQLIDIDEKFEDKRWQLYQVIGIKKAKTIKERRQALELDFLDNMPDLPVVFKMLDKDAKEFYGKVN
ncbi:MAG: hypothetical protein HQK79_08630 [Desulfobacterales bacterium]|nr:hypothetical protein [Desulfobacterales bacterium]